MWCYFDLYNTKFMKLFNCFDFKKNDIQNKSKRAWFEEYTIPAPIGIKTIPIIKKDNMTGLGVRMGCHAFNRCCLKAVSMK